MMCYHGATDFSSNGNEGLLSNNPVHFALNKTILLFIRWCSYQLHYHWMDRISRVTHLITNCNNNNIVFILIKKKENLKFTK